MSYTAPTGNQVDLPIGGGVSYTSPTGNTVDLPLADPTPAPSTLADAYSIALNTARTVAAPGVFANDSLYAGTLTSHTSPAHGTLVLNSDGSFTYTPTTGYTGTDSFTYTVGNVYGFGTATVTLTVYAAPTLVAHAYNATKNTALTIGAPGVLNGATLNGATITANSTPSHGTLTLNSNGSFVYTPTTGYTGSDSFTVTISNYAGSSTATMSITVTALPSAVTDSYATPQGVTLNVAAPGALANDDLEGATAALGASPTHGTVTFNSDGSFTYVPASGYSGTDSFTYVLTNVAGTSTGTVNLTVTALPATVRYLQRSWRGPWSEPGRQSLETAGAWSVPLRKFAEWSGSYSAATRVPIEDRIPWTVVPRRMTDRIAPWTRASRLADETRIPWDTVPRQRADRRVPWSLPPTVQIGRDLAYKSPPRRVRSTSSRFAVQPTKAIDLRLPWQHAPNKRRPFFIPWGEAHRVAWTPPASPGVDIPPPPPTVPIYLPPAGSAVALPLECLWFDEDASELALPIGPYACYVSTLYRRSITVINSVTVVRLPERTPISVAAGSIQASVDDLFISFGLTLADPSHWSYLAPDSGGNKLVEINLNGRVFVAMIENDGQQWQFPGTSIAVTGKSQSAQLDAPYAPTGSYVQPSDMTAQQIMNALLEFTGFTLDYQILDWLIPAGTFHFNGLTPLAAIKLIAAAAGGIVQSHPNDTVLIIRYRYPVKPWDWTTTSPDKTIPFAILEQFTSAAEDPETPAYNQAFVSGDQVGVADPIIRNGTAGDLRFPDQFIDPLIVTHPVALARGGQELSNTGKKTEVAGHLALGAVDDTTLPGLVWPLDLCSVVADPSFMAQCATNDIAFSMQQSGNGTFVLVVDQAISLERQLTNAN